MSNMTNPLTSDPKPAALADFPVSIRLPIQWGDQDAFGHVNNTTAIRWFESARVAYLDAGGLDHLMSRGGLGPILASITCNYRKQLGYPDIIHVGARVSRLGRSSMTMHHAVFSERLQAIAADGDSVVVVFNYDTQRPVRIPDEIRDAMQRLEGKPLSETA
jgi:acyl-CoA thioester hydrolase